MRNYLVIYNRRAGRIVRHQSFLKPQRALTARFEAEREFRDDPDIEIVVLAADSWDSLPRTHSRYFKGVRELAEDALEREARTAIGVLDNPPMDAEFSDRKRADVLRDALREVIGMLEDARNGGSAWRDSIAARLQRAADDPAQQTAVMHELADLALEAVVAGAVLGELTDRGGPPPDLPRRPGWYWVLLREMADNMPDEVLDPDL
jgi:cytochrome P450